MPAIEVNAASSICRKCGTAYGRLKGYFPVCYGQLYKGTGYMPYCKECIDGMYNSYLLDCRDPKMAVRQMCRKLDLYWNEKIFEIVEKQNSPKSMMTSYISKVNGIKYAGKSYDDTLIEENMLWVDPGRMIEKPEEQVITVTPDTPEDEEVSEDIVNFWGPGYTPSMYLELEQRRKCWMSKYPEGTELDIGTEALIRQICSLEIDINKARMADKPIDKYVNALNTVLGSLNLKPVQNAQSNDAALEGTPMGVWIQRFESGDPVPEPDPELRDVDGIIKYILTWYYGHLAHMVGVKNAHSKLYEEEMNRLRVTKPEFEGEGEDDLLFDVFGDPDSEE